MGVPARANPLVKGGRWEFALNSRYPTARMPRLHCSRHARERPRPSPPIPQQRYNTVHAGDHRFCPERRLLFVSSVRADHERHQLRRAPSDALPRGPLRPRGCTEPQHRVEMTGPDVPVYLPALGCRLSFALASPSTEPVGLQDLPDHAAQPTEPSRLTASNFCAWWPIPSGVPSRPPCRTR